MKLSVIGTGYVGLVSGVCLAEKGHEVVCVDIDPAKVDLINAGKTPIHEPGLPQLLRKHAGRRLRATTDLEAAVLGTELTLIAVGTPFDGRHIDLKFVRRCAEQIGDALRRKKGYHLAVVKSTVVPGTTDEVVAPILEARSGRRAGKDFGVGMNPEFLSEGEALNDFMKPDRIVLGGNDARTHAGLARVYRPFKNVPVLRTSNKTAEMIKYTSNSLLATLISFANEIGNLCSDLGGVDTVDVMEGVHLSHYLTPFAKGGRVRAPIASFVASGCGFGGSCLPKDVKALIARGQAAGNPMGLLEQVIAVNERQPARMMALLKKHVADLRGVPVAVLGLAFKPDTDDLRESPARPLIELLSREGAKVLAYDPVAMPAAQKAWSDLDVTYCASLPEAVQKAKALLLVTSWKQFARLPALIEKRPSPPVLVDGRRQIRPARVARYEGIGR
jgi:UDPglucose 6-dehydrogenase/GDP-mannose 6-dehydrogenase